MFPTMAVSLDGVTAIEVSTGAETVSRVVPCTLLKVAVIVVLPKVNPLASPAAVMVATLGEEELQVTDEVRFCVLLSE